MASGVAAKKSNAPTLLTRDDSPEESEFPFERRGQPEGGDLSSGADSMASAQGPTYRWQDGEHTRSVRLQTDLIVATRSTRDQRAGEVVRKASEHAAGQSNPVFRTESGEVMTLPGGVLLALDQDWAQAQVDSFFATNRIAQSRVSDRSFAVNAFFIDTEPGFPSLDLANALAGQNGVLIASPNWQREVATR